MEWTGEALKKQSIVWFWIAGLLALSLIGGVSIRYTSVFSTSIYADRAVWGQFGDYFGGVLNPLLSFFAFVALLITLRVQLGANAKSEKWSQDQVREQRLFQLLNMVGQSAINAKYRSTYERTQAAEFEEGHAALHHAWNDFAKHRLANIPTGKLVPMERYQLVEKEFLIFKRTAWPSFSVFVQSSFLLIDFVSKNATLQDGFVQFSMGAIRAQMTESERLLLWYSALCMPQYAHTLPIFVAFEFVSGDVESNDPLFRSTEELSRCARVKANLIF